MPWKYGDRPVNIAARAGVHVGLDEYGEYDGDGGDPLSDLGEDDYDGWDSYAYQDDDYGENALLGAAEAEETNGITVQKESFQRPRFMVR